MALALFGIILMNIGKEFGVKLSKDFFLSLSNPTSAWNGTYPPFSLND